MLACSIEVIDSAITATISRTIITHGCTLTMTLSMLFLGGPALHNFALALTIGEAGLRFAGLHMYDGHAYGMPAGERKRLIPAGYDRLAALVRAVLQAGQYGLVMGAPQGANDAPGHVRRWLPAICRHVR